MSEPLEDEVEVPYGLVNMRMPLGVPAWAFVLLAVLGSAPVLLWGRGKWWVSVLMVIVGMGIAALAKDDPQFLKAWVGEMRLKDYYD